MSGTKCRHGLVPEECPVALGIHVDGARDDGDGVTVYHEWRPVCDQVDGACPRDMGAGRRGEGR